MHIGSTIELGSVIRDRRRALGLSQTEVARRADVGRQWLIAVEQGKSGAEVGLVLRTLAALGLGLAIDDAAVVAAPPAERLSSIDLDAVVSAARAPRP